MALVSLMALYALVAGCTSKPVAEREPSSEYGKAKLGEAYFFDENTINSAEVTYRRYDLNNADDLSRLESGARAFLSEFKRRKDNKGAPEREQVIVTRKAKAPFNKFDFTDGTLKNGAEYILDIFSSWRSNDITADDAKLQIAQVGRAIELKYTVPVKNHYEFLAFPVYLSRFLSAPSVSEDYKGQDPDTNYVRNEVMREQDISKVDFVDHFDFKGMNNDCKYLKAKRGFGVHAGFQVTCNGVDYKMKFGNERYSGPFNTRVYRSLGYIAPHINYYEKIAVDYDRRVFTEYNSRAETKFKVTVAAIPVLNKSNKEFENPFEFISGFITKSGQFVTVKEAQARLVTKPITLDTLAFTDDMVDANYESQLSKIVFGPSSLTLKKDPVMGDEVGPWIPDDFNYRDFKEVRGIIVLAAWTGNFDMRKDNLRLVIAKDEKGKKGLRLAFGDAGSGLGDATGTHRSGSTIDDMKWEVSSVYRDMNDNDNRFPHEDKERIELSGIGELEYAKAFYKIKLSDAQWMLRKLCQFKPEQIKTALVASGLSSAEVLLAHAKLLERRNKMMDHFKVDEDFKMSCYVPVNRKMNYDPLKDPLVTVSYKKNSEATFAPDRGHRIVNGRLVMPLAPQQ